MYEYAVKILEVIDGDTVRLEVDLGFHVKKTETVRLLGINTPELHSADPAERELALKAKLALQGMVNRATDFKAVTEKPYTLDKYGRWLATLYSQDAGATIVPGQVLPWTDMNQRMIDGGYAKFYDGGKRT